MGPSKPGSPLAPMGPVGPWYENKRKINNTKTVKDKDTGYCVLKQCNNFCKVAFKCAELCGTSIKLRGQNNRLTGSPLGPGSPICPGCPCQDARFDFNPLHWLQSEWSSTTMNHKSLSMVLLWTLLTWGPLSPGGPICPSRPGGP